MLGLMHGWPRDMMRSDMVGYDSNRRTGGMVSQARIRSKRKLTRVFLGLTRHQR